MSNRKRIPQRTYVAPRHRQGQGREPSRTVGGRVAGPGQAGVRLLAASALGSAAIMALPVGAASAALITGTSTSPANTAAASRGSETVSASLTADTQPSSPPAAQPPASSSTGPMSTFFSSVYRAFQNGMELEGQAEINNAQGIQALGQAAGQGLVNAGSSVYQAFQNGAQLEGQAEINNAQANQAFTQGLVNAFPYAVQDMKNWGATGAAGGSVLGGISGGVIGATAGSLTIPGIGTGAGWLGGGAVGAQAGFTAGSFGGSLLGFTYGLTTAPTWSNGSLEPQVQNSPAQNSAVAVQGSGGGGAAAATSPADTWAALQQIASVPSASPPGQVLWPDGTVATAQPDPSATASPWANSSTQKTDNTTDNTSSVQQTAAANGGQVQQTATNDGQTQPPAYQAPNTDIAYNKTSDGTDAWS